MCGAEGKVHDGATRSSILERPRTNEHAKEFVTCVIFSAFTAWYTRSCYPTCLLIEYSLQVAQVDVVQISLIRLGEVVRSDHHPQLFCGKR